MIDPAFIRTLEYVQRWQRERSRHGDGCDARLDECQVPSRSAFRRCRSAVAARSQTVSKSDLARPLAPDGRPVGERPMRYHAAEKQFRARLVPRHPRPRFDTTSFPSQHKIVSSTLQLVNSYDLRTFPDRRIGRSAGRPPNDPQNSRPREGRAGGPLKDGHCRADIDSAAFRLCGTPKCESRMPATRPDAAGTPPVRGHPQ